jgi:putative Ca2+/H+ antiporter (TMEM165/GDT1 family)
MKLSVFWAAFLVAVVAEMGCLARNTALFATQGAALSVFLGTLLADLVLLLVSALLGEMLHRLLPEPWIERVAGVVFLVMGSLMLLHQH